MSITIQTVEDDVKNLHNNLQIFQYFVKMVNSYDAQEIREKDCVKQYNKERFI